MGVTKEQAKAQISALVERFKKYEAEGKLHDLNESNTKAVFIEPFFEALGWNVRDVDEVSREEKVSKGKADYAFRLSNVIRFFLEAKRPSVPLEEGEAWQTINYAFLKSVSWAVLTNFKRLIIYNPEWKAKKSDENRFLQFDYTEYLTRFDDLWLLSRESFSSNGLEKTAEKYGRKPKRDPVTKTLFQDFMRWRSILSKNIAKYDPKNKFTKDYMDEVVQRFLNRLVFIRACEDRGLENELLRAAVREWKTENKRKLMSHIRDIFADFNENYDSDIFFPHAAGDLALDDDVIEQVINELYESPEGVRYDFSAIDADVLGNIYEQYLATLLRKGGGLTKQEEKKQAIRKEMGIYYTPTYIVDYIVKNTLGELVSKAKNAEELEKIRVLDPACGSGSFLIRAYEMLSEAYGRKNGGDHEMLGENVSRNAYTILAKNLFGVDLDKKAIEIAELNLLLRAARRKGLLPMLSDNIKQGNSLISGTEEELEKHFGDKWQEKHPFNWEQEFAEAMKQGGFDVIIGNPPYVNNRNLPDEEKAFFENAYSTAFQQYDIYVLFFERALKLLKKGGYLGFITPNKFAITKYGEPLRRMLLENKIVKIVDVSQLDVFGDASTYPYITIIQKTKEDDSSFEFIAPISTALEKESEKTKIKQNSLNSAKPLLLSFSKMEKSILEKIKGEKLLEVFRAKPTSAAIDEKGNAFAITNKGIERYALIPSDKKIPFKDEWKIVLPAIMLKKICYAPTGALLDSSRRLPINTVYVIHSKDKRIDLKYILGVLNSKLTAFYARKYFGATAMRGGFIEWRAFEIESIPIRNDVKQEPIVYLVDKMLLLNKKLEELGSKQSSERQHLEAEIARVDKQIDELVYELYGITEEERKIIEESLA